jgi:hypothetical protein
MLRYANESRSLLLISRSLLPLHWASFDTGAHLSLERASAADANGKVQQEMLQIRSLAEELEGRARQVAVSVGGCIHM